MNDKEKKIVRQLDDKHRITIPQEILDEMHIETGDYVILKKNNGKIQIIKANITENGD